ncbi:hypothetical protein SO802_008718 [Lithocarpus litseifolius]|uniref:B-like cyclin n=1 Tax=Lithocarpus litseifolius TaxID=425828 RepID=A0AAW2DDL4_9ROSI
MALQEEETQQLQSPTTVIDALFCEEVEESKYVFEAKTIKRMELLVLSTLQWRMNPVTPISFLYHIIKRLGLKNPMHWDFLLRCEHLYLFVIATKLSNEIDCLSAIDIEGKRHSFVIYLNF